jgi:hypothetical protein
VGATVGLGLGVGVSGLAVVGSGVEALSIRFEEAVKLDATLEAALWAAPHPVARHTKTRMIADRRRLLVDRLMPAPLKCDMPPGQVSAVMILPMNWPSLTRLGGPDAAHVPIVTPGR